MPSIYRIEKDSIGTKEVPADVYYGVQSLRGAENFPITGLTLHPELINSLAYIKKASAICNGEQTPTGAVDAINAVWEGELAK